MSEVSVSWAIRSVMPTMAFMGVRMSWDMLERNSLLALLADTSSALSRSSLALFSSAMAISFFCWRRCIQKIKPAHTQVISTAKVMTTITVVLTSSTVFMATALALTRKTSVHSVFSMRYME